MDMSQEQPSAEKKSNKDIGDHLVGEKNRSQPVEDQNQVLSNDDQNEGGDKSAGNVSNPNINQNKVDETPAKQEGADPRGYGQETYPMRSTAAVTDGMFKSQYAQQRERESSANQYRNSFARDTYTGVGGFGKEFYEKENRSPPRYTHEYRREASPVRTTRTTYYERPPVHMPPPHLPPPNGLPPRTIVTQNRVIDIQTTQSYGLYEQHRESREQREHVEYQKIQNEHSKSYEIAQMSVGIRDRILNSYRAEIESHKFLERDFTSLKAHIEDLKRRKEALEISVTTLQGDYEAQLQSQENVVSSLKNELDMLRNLNDDKQRESVEVNEQTQAVKIEITGAEKAIGEINVEIQTVVSHNQQLEREDESLRQNIGEQ